MFKTALKLFSVHMQNNYIDKFEVKVCDISAGDFLFI